MVADFLRDTNGKTVRDDNGEYQPQGLIDPTNPVVAICNFVFQMENFCYYELNRSSRLKDKSKLKTMGPFGAAMEKIVCNA